jgi:hypothetical protein
MKIVIKKGRHYPWLIPIAFPIWVRKNEATFRKAKFMFTDSCMFDLHDEDQWDVNKLFGFSIGHHQKRSSFRFGWRPKLQTKTIEIVAYEYHDGIRQKTMSIAEIELNKCYNFRIGYLPHINRTFYHISDCQKNKLIKDRFIIDFTNEINLNKKGGLGYTLGIYFGGNEKAPQDITIHRKRY